jgi:hypothetical protein
MAVIFPGSGCVSLLSEDGLEMENLQKQFIHFGGFRKKKICNILEIMEGELHIVCHGFCYIDVKWCSNMFGCHNQW